MLRGRRGGEGLGIMMLLVQLYQVGFDRIPPVTLATIAVNSCIYLKVFRSLNLPSVAQACVSTFYVWHKRQWMRLLWGSFFHLDEWHLYYNMASFLWKGLTLEKKYGSAYLAFMLAMFSVLTNVTLVGLNMLAEHILEDSSYISSCAAGFSGVIFALKVVTTSDLPPGIQYVMGLFPVPTRLVVWAELFIIQLLIPNASFTGHLAGILVGLAYVKGPLKAIMNSFIPPAGARPRGPDGTSYTYRYGTTGERDRPPREQTHRQTDRTHRYTAGLTEQEQLDRALWASRAETSARTQPNANAERNNSRSHPATEQDPPADPETRTAPSEQHSTQQQAEVEDIRRRRLARFT